MLAKNFLIAIIKFYRRYISLYKQPACRFCPTCSQYAIESIQKNGTIKGALKSAWRLSRCHPFSQGGYDPPV